MTTTVLITIVVATIMLVVAVNNWLKCRRLQGDVAELKAKLDEVAQEKELLKADIAHIARQRGVGEDTVLAIAGEMARMENNLSHMDDVPGRKQVMRALERMKGTLQAENYTIVPLIGQPYVEGMNAKVVFVPDESIEVGDAVILSVQKPQVNYKGTMIQAASITVGQNV
jgi:predicted nuclease with TOPRIM domain